MRGVESDLIVDVTRVFLHFILGIGSRGCVL